MYSTQLNESNITSLLNIPKSKEKLDEFLKNQEYNEEFKKYLKNKTNHFFTKKQIQNINKALLNIQHRNYTFTQNISSIDRILNISLTNFLIEYNYTYIKKLGEGSYGHVLLIKDSDNNNFAVKVLIIKNKLEFFEELATSIYFNEKKIGPKIYSSMNIKLIQPTITHSVYFIVMEQLDMTLNEYLYDNPLSHEQEDEIYNLIKNSINYGYACSDIKFENIMIKDNKFYLIDFGKFCCDVYKNYNIQALIDLQTIMLSFDSSQSGGLFFTKINQILKNKKRFAKIIKIFTDESKKCNILDKYNYKEKTIGERYTYMFNWYVTRYLVLKFDLLLNTSRNIPDYIRRSFGTLNIRIFMYVKFKSHYIYIK